MTALFKTFYSDGKASTFCYFQHLHSMCLLVPRVAFTCHLRMKLTRRKGRLGIEIDPTTEFRNQKSSLKIGSPVWSAESLSPSRLANARFVQVSLPRMSFVISSEGIRNPYSFRALVRQPPNSSLSLNGSRPGTRS